MHSIELFYHLRPTPRLPYSLLLTTAVDPPQRQPSSLADDPLSIITFMLQRGYSLLAPSLLQSTPVDLANRIAHNLL